MTTSTTVDAEVVVAGGGVVGITTALLLSRRGIRTIVVEREEGPRTLPRAHAINPRTVEILRELSLDAEKLRAIAAPAALTSEVRFVTSLTGTCFGTLPYERQGEAIDSVAATGTMNIPQPALEGLLFDLAAHDEFIELRRSHEWIAVREEPDHVVVTSRAAEQEYELRSRFLVAADGASSSVREALGIGMSGVNSLASAVTATFVADLTEQVKTRPGVLHWILGTQLGGNLLSYLPDRLWTYNVALPPGQVDMSRFTADRVLQDVRAALGPGAADVPVELVAVTPWTVHAEVADRYQKGRCFLAGDAAHRFPPTGGLGLNTGLQDAHNLAWKIAAVIDGWAPMSLLSTYDRERRPVATRNADQSLNNLTATFALDRLKVPAASEETAEAFVADAANAELIGNAIEQQRAHFDSVALQLGFSYNPDEPAIDDVTEFVPRAKVGRRLPHGQVTVGGDSVSLLDLIDPEAFTVILLDVSVEAPVLPPKVPVRVVRLDGTDPSVATWIGQVGLDGAAGLVVRPDGHILAVLSTDGGHSDALGVFDDLFSSSESDCAEGDEEEISAFRRHLYPLNHPRLALMRGHDPISHAETLKTMPAIGDLLADWEQRFEATRFTGITTDGNLVPGLYPLGAQESAPTEIACRAAEALLAALSPQECSRVNHDVNSKVWRAWMNPEIYLNRFGLRLEDLDQSPRAHALDLVKASLSDSGYRTIRDIMRTNRFLGELVELPKLLNEHSYNINLFGTPSPTEPWGWNLYGHHLCISCLFIGDQQVLTPVFFGAEPNEIDRGDHAGTTLFTGQEAGGLALMRGLDPELAEKAQLYQNKRDPHMPPGRLHPADELHLAGAFEDNRQIPYEGVNLAHCSTADRQRLLDLVEAFLHYLPEGPRAARVAMVRQHLANTWFCWIGGTDEVTPFYYRIQSPVVLIEFDHHAGVYLANTEPERFHIHTIIRTPNGNDYGAALVSELTGAKHRLDGRD